MENRISSKKPAGRVREASKKDITKAIDQHTLEDLRKSTRLSRAHLTQKLRKLQNEWDIEKTLEINASVFALTGLFLGSLVNKRWYILPGIVTAFLLQHGVQGWCPPLPLFRRIGVRTRREIDEERYALKVLRGDFSKLSPKSTAPEILKVLRS